VSLADGPQSMLARMTFGATLRALRRGGKRRSGASPASLDHPARSRCGGRGGGRVEVVAVRDGDRESVLDVRDGFGSGPVRCICRGGAGCVVAGLSGQWLRPGSEGTGRGSAYKAHGGYGRGQSCTTQVRHLTPTFPVLRHGLSRKKLKVTAATTRPGYP
jgi:hypothetical protein